MLLRLTEQLLHVQEMVFVEATFPSKALGAVQVCVFFPFILGIKFVGRTSRGHILCDPGKNKHVVYYVTN